MSIINSGNMPPMIPQNNQPVAADVQPVKKQEVETVAQKPGQAAAKPDTVEISPRAMVISKALNQVVNMADVRESVVQKAVQERVVENSRVPAPELAAKLLLED
ncbi:MAG TPA: hypothetical protein P5511_01710 [Candidatus Goldiibacteriota bacterium]|nr:hypothetical protein [Candidatus Goldiibacteriota bacterium]